MIEINLLPKELKKKRIKTTLNFQTDRVKVFIAIGYVSLLIFILLIFLTGSFVRKRQISSLKIKERELSPMSERVAAIDKDISLLKARMSALDEITTRKFLWAKKMNELSDLVLPDIWFRRVYTDSNQTLVVEGSVLEKKDPGMATLGRFIKNLRENESFFKDFRDIKLESVERKDVQKREVLDFTIVLYFG